MVKSKVIDGYMQDLDWLCKKVIIKDTKEDIIEDDAEVEGEEDANNYA